MSSCRWAPLSPECLNEDTASERQSRADTRSTTESFNEKLREWENYYNDHRPHGDLDVQALYERLITRMSLGALPAF
jgi:hypothetical protein